ncbi:MAG TPA: Pr6Pr family membrane protein [Ferruginibacter sp.]|nr:hypothetical protein [Chitinophagaceae bacterium]HRI25494.1 Pr6Pr family membrane protein [Ferruginibacter sp.]
MKEKTVKIPAAWLAMLSVLGWFALISQLYLIIQNRLVPVPETIIRYFSFFTILTNLLVAVCVSFLWIKPASKPGHFFARQTTLTAITVYIVIVGVVYNAILRFLWNPQGLQYITDELLHTVIPLLFLLCWILFVSKNELEYRHAFVWLLYPLVYLVWTFIHGAITAYYPYPFVNVTELGYRRVLINCGGLFIAFLGLSLFLVAAGKYISKKKA